MPNVQSPRSWSGVIGKCGGPIHVDRRLERVVGSWSGQQHVHLGVGAVAGRRRTAGPACGPSGGGRAGACRGTARRRAARTAGAARCRRRARGVGCSASSWAMATHEVWPPTPTNSAPTAGVEPRTPHRWTRIQPGVRSSLRWRVGQGGQPLGVDLVGPGDRDPAGRHRPQRGRAVAAFEHGPLAEHRARADLGERPRRRPPPSARRRAARTDPARRRPARPAPCPPSASGSPAWRRRA